MKPYVTIARIVKTRGIRGEVAAAVLTDFPERFEGTRKVRVVVGGVESFQRIESHWFHRGRVILKFEGLNRPHEVQHLVGGEVQVPEEERVSAPGDTYFHSDLIGCRLLDEGRPIGTVTDVFETGGGANLVVRTEDGREAMVPLARAYVAAVDLEARTIEARLPPGLLDLALPVSGGKRKSPAQVKKSDED